MAAPVGGIHFQNSNLEIYVAWLRGCPCRGKPFPEFRLEHICFVAPWLPLPGESVFRILIMCVLLTHYVSRLRGCPCRGNPFSDFVCFFVANMVLKNPPDCLNDWNRINSIFCFGLIKSNTPPTQIPPPPPPHGPPPPPPPRGGVWGAKSIHFAEIHSFW